MDDFNETFFTKIAGVTFEGRQVYVKRLCVGEKLELVRQPHNAYDSNAIAIFNKSGNQIGFISKDIASRMALFIDNGSSFSAIVASITGGEIGQSFGVNIEVRKTQKESKTKDNKAFFSTDDFFEQNEAPKSSNSNNHSNTIYTHIYEENDFEKHDYLSNIEPYYDNSDELEDIFYDFNDGENPDDNPPEGLGVGDVTFEDCDSEYP